MIKAKSKILKGIAVIGFFLISHYTHAQVEVLPFEEDKKVYYFDSVSATSLKLPESRKVPDSIVKKLQRDEAFWYANAQIQKEKKRAKEANVNINWVRKEWVRTFLWLLMIGLFTAVMVWYIASLNIRLFRKKSAAIQSPTDETVTEDIFSIPYNKEIGNALEAGNYRQVIRLYYLRTLSLLAQKNLIQFQQDRTNSVYVMQVHGTPFYKDFFNLTRSYEYTWYGKFELTKPQFTVLQKDFETFYQQLDI